MLRSRHETRRRTLSRSGIRRLTASAVVVTEPSGVPAWPTITAGHLGLVSDPKSVTRVIEQAAKAIG
jgi:hypothetical protein